MQTRIDRRFEELARQDRAALVTFVMAGDPDLATCLAILRALPKAGADVIELGMPFTDPMADGPAIQAAALRALGAGTTLAKTLALASDFRKSDFTTPVVLMGYYNPVYVYGVEAFLRDAKAAGVDGLIVVDLPPEEDAELCLPALAAGLNFIRSRRRRRTKRGCQPSSPIPQALSIMSRSPALPGPRRRNLPRSPQRSGASRRTRACRSRSASA